MILDWYSDWLRAGFLADHMKDHKKKPWQWRWWRAIWWFRLPPRLGIRLCGRLFLTEESGVRVTFDACFERWRKEVFVVVYLFRFYLHIKLDFRGEEPRTREQVHYTKRGIHPRFFFSLRQGEYRATFVEPPHQRLIRTDWDA